MYFSNYKILLLVFFFLVSFNTDTLSWARLSICFWDQALFLLTMTLERHLTSQANNHKQKREHTGPCFVTLTHMNTLISFPSITGTHNFLTESCPMPYEDYLTCIEECIKLSSLGGQSRPKASAPVLLTYKHHSISNEDLALYIKLVFTTNKREISIWQSITETVSGSIESKDMEILLYVPTTISSV